MDFALAAVVFAPALLMPVAEFQRQLDELIARVKATPRQPGVEQIRIPSERAYAERERRRVEGITIERVICGRLEALAAGKTGDVG